MTVQLASIQEILQSTLSRPVVFRAVLAQISGSVKAGLMLSQAIYWCERTKDPEGWFYKTREEWKEEIFLTRSEQERTRRELCARGFLQEERKGNPAQLFFRVDLDAVYSAIERLGEIQEAKNPPAKKAGKSPPKKAENQPSNWQETLLLDGGNRSLRKAENQPSIKGTEMTSHMTRMTAQMSPVRASKPLSYQELVYEAYPRRVGHQAALKSIGKAIGKIAEQFGFDERGAAEWLYRVVREFAASPAGNQGEYTPHCKTWMNQERWNDNRREWHREHGSGERPTTVERNLAAAAAAIRRIRGVDSYSTDGTVAQLRRDQVDRAANDSVLQDALCGDTIRVIEGIPAGSDRVPAVFPERRRTAKPGK